MKKFAVSITRVETRIVWAEDADDAIDVALETEPADGEVIEETLSVEAVEAEDDDVALNEK